MMRGGAMATGGRAVERASIRCDGNLMRSSRTSRLRACAVLAALAVAGCASTTGFLESTTRFAEATAKLCDASQLYFTDVNHINVEVALVAAEYAAVPFTKSLLERPFFPEAEMAARQAMLSALKTYASTLARIAGDNLGGGFRNDLALLRSDVQALDARLRSVSNSKLQLLNEDAAFASVVVAALGGMIVEQVQVTALAEAILAAEPAMYRAAELLAQDVKLMTAKIRQARALEFAIAVDSVNPLLATATLEQRLSLVGGLRPLRDRVIATRSVGTEFEATLVEYRTAQRQLAQLARGKRDPQSLSETVAAVDLFAQRAHQLIALMQMARTVHVAVSEPALASALTKETLR